RALVEVQAERRPAQPALDAPAACELSALAPRREERLLEQIVRVGGVPREPPEEPMDGVAVGMEEGLEIAETVAGCGHRRGAAGRVARRIAGRVMTRGGRAH